MSYKIPLVDPYITEDDVAAVAQAVREKRLSQGKYVKAFEEAFAKYCGTKYAVAVSSGTAALHTALAALSVRRGDEVIIPSLTYVSTANCVLYQGAKPVIADIDSNTYNIDPDDVKRKITAKTKVIIPVHFAGQAADVNAVAEIAEAHNLEVVEDAAEAHGATCRGRKAGSMGRAGCFSFYPSKNMTTGEGGMIVTNDGQLADRMRMIKSLGQATRYHHTILGYSYRMTDIQAALGLVQLKRLDWVNRKKVEKARFYDEKTRELFGNELKTPYVAPYASHVYMFYPLRFDDKKTREKVFTTFEKKGVETRMGFPPLHLQPLYQRLFKYKLGIAPVAEEVSETLLCIPIFPQMKRQQQKYVLSALREGLKQ